MNSELYRKSVARLVTRFQGQSDGLIIGALLKSGEGILKPNTVYEVYQIPYTGELILQEVGESIVGVSPHTVPESFGRLHWSCSIQDLLNSPSSPYMFLSKEEVEELKLNENE